MDGAVYPSCAAIESELFFNVDQNAYCCCFDYGHYADAKVFPLADAPFPRQAYLEWRDGVRARHRRGQISRNCRACCRLETRRWPADRDGSIRVLTLTHYASCNLRCTFCGNRALRMDRRYHEVDVRRLVRDMVDRGLFARDAHVMFAGGEPSIWARFEDVLAMLLPHRIRFLVCTNGVRYMPALDAAWDPPGRLEVICGVHAGTYATHRRLVGGADVFDDVLSNLARYVRAGRGGVRAKMVLQEENYSEVELFLGRCAEVGVLAVEVDADRNQHTLSDAALDAVARFYRRACDSGLRVTWGDKLLTVRAQQPVRWGEAFDRACRLGEWTAGEAASEAQRTVRIDNLGASPASGGASVWVSQVDTVGAGMLDLEPRLVAAQGAAWMRDAVSAAGRSLELTTPGGFAEFALPNGPLRLTLITNAWSSQARISVDGQPVETLDLFRPGAYSQLREVRVGAGWPTTIRLPAP